MYVEGLGSHAQFSVGGGTVSWAPTPYSPFRTTGRSWQCTGSTQSFGLSGGLCNPQQGRQFTKQNRQILLCGRALLPGWQARRGLAEHYSLRSKSTLV